MEGVLQTKGLLSLPSNPRTRVFQSSLGLKQRFFSTKPKTPAGFSLSSNGFQKFPSFVPKNYGVVPKERNLFICRAEAAAAASPGDGQPAFGEPEKPKVFGIETVTFKKIIPLGLMFFCILFNYTILRDTKDVLVVTAKGSSAEIIPFLKTWVNLPMAVGFMLLYTKLSNVLSKKALFYSVILPFIAFFGAFGFVLYPLSGYIHPEALADSLLNVLGPRFLGPLAILRIWSFCLFYVMAELWGSVVISVLFWGFANQITTVEEAKRFYPLFGLGANVALIFSGRTVKYFSKLRQNLGPGVDGWAMSLRGMMSIVVMLGFAICGLYWWVNAYVPLPTRSKKKKEKPKMGTMESLKFLFPSPNEYSSFMGDFSTATGIATFTMMLLSQVIFEKYGWGVAAKITPTVLLLTGVGFFSLILFGGPLSPAIASLGMTPLLAAVYVGALQNIFSKSAKYSLFDPCKEMAYIPLDEDTKSGGALIQQFMILTFGSLANSTPYLGGVLLVIVLAWLAAASSLDKQFTALRQEEELEKEMERAAVKIPVVAQEGGGNGSLASDSVLNPTAGDSTGGTKPPRNM
ncbi:unnamed protein product [Malus baccata var. baccata]